MATKFLALSGGLFPTYRRGSRLCALPMALKMINLPKSFLRCGDSLLFYEVSSPSSLTKKGRMPYAPTKSIILFVQHHET